MKRPRRWCLKRPGQTIPVFFLSILPVWSQVSWDIVPVTAFRGNFVSRPTACDAMLNQAGLGWNSTKTLSIHHIRPFITDDLGISTLTALIPAGGGSFGSAISSFGLRGFRQTSVWIAYGMKVHQAITAGLGIHFWSSSIPGEMLHHPGFSFAAGIQARLNQKLIIGGHILHPAGWTSPYPGIEPLAMVLSAGLSYTFFKTTSYHADLHASASGILQLNHCLGIQLRERFKLLVGMHNQPFGVLCGITLKHLHWKVHLAFEYLMDTGFHPSTSFTHAW